MTAALRSSSTAQDRRHEIPGGDVGEGAIEGGDNHPVEVEGGKQARLGGDGREAKDRRLRTEERARMRLEGEDDGGNAKATGLAACLREQGGMSAMDAVEIAYGDYPAFQRGGDVIERERCQRRLPVGDHDPPRQTSCLMSARAPRPAVARKACTLARSGASRSPKTAA